MRSSYHFLFAGVPAQEKQSLLYSVLHQTTTREEEGLHLLEIEGLQCSLSMSGDVDETVQVCLREASSLMGVILFVQAKECSKGSLLMQAELLQALSVPLLAIIISGIEGVSPEFISTIEQELFRSLRQGGLLHDELLVLGHTLETQSETARRLLQVLSQRVLYATPPTTKDARPLQLMLRARRRVINDREFALATLMQGTIMVGDKVANNRSHASRVAGLYDAYDLQTPQGSIRVEEEPREIFVALDGYWWGSGEVLTSYATQPWVEECQVLLYWPASCSHALDTSKLSQIGLSWEASNQRAMFGLYPQHKRPLQPGSFAQATLRDLRGGQFLLPERFFTWYPTSATQNTKAEGVGRVLYREAK